MKHQTTIIADSVEPSRELSRQLAGLVRNCGLNGEVKSCGTGLVIEAVGEQDDIFDLLDAVRASVTVERPNARVTGYIFADTDNDRDPTMLKTTSSHTTHPQTSP